MNLDGGTLTAAIIFKGAGTVANSIMNFNGGTLLPSVASATFMQGLSRANVRDGGAIIDTNGRDLTIGQALLHSNIGGDSATDGGLTKNGAGRLLLNGANTYNGGTTINAGLLEFGSGATPASGGIAIKSAGALSATGAFLTVSEWLNSGRISIASTGAIALTTDSFEDINFSAYPNLMLGASAPAGYFGTLTPAGNTYRLGGGGSTLTLPNTNALTGANDVVIGAPGSTGTVILSNTNDYTGSTTINSGALQIDAPAGPGGTITIKSPGSLNVSSATQWLDTGRIASSSDGVLALTSDNFEDIDLTGRPDLVLGAAPAATVFGTITPGGAAYRLGGSGTLTLFNENALTGAHGVIIGTGASPGTVILSNANDYTGATTINPGATLQIGDGGSDGSIASSSAIVNNGALVFNPALVQEFAQSISGSGTLSKQGAGTLILSGANNHTGATILAGGVLRLANSDALGDSPFSATNGNVRLELSSGITVTNSIRLVGSGLNLGGVLGSVEGENTLTDFGLGGNGGTRISVSVGSKLNLPNPIALSPGVTVQNFRIIGAGTAFLGADNSAVVGTANLFLLGLGTEAGPTIEIGNDRAFGLGTIDFQPLSNSTLQSSDATPRTIANALRFSDASLNRAAFGAPGTGDLTFTGAASSFS